MRQDNLTKYKISRIGRREFLSLTGGAGAMMLAGPSLFGPFSSASAQTATTLSKFTEQLPIPAKLDFRTGGTLDLKMAPGLQRFHSSLPLTPTWGYAGAPYLGPTVEVRRSVPLSVTARNRLGSHPLAFALDPTVHGTESADATKPRTAVHLHGGNTSPENDGGPLETFKPNQNRNFYYNNNQEAATIWYHDHALGITRLNVYAGLAGFYWIRDEVDTGDFGNPLGLPVGAYEVPLVIQDKMFNTNGTLAYPPGGMGRIWAPEFFGNVAVVNGKAFPNFNVNKGLYRFRMVNGSNARVYVLKLSNGRPINQIGGDGGLLNAPVQLKQLTLAPGERADVLIDFSGMKTGARVVLTNSAPTPFPNGPRSGHQGALPIPEIMQFTVGSNSGFTGPIPATLRPTPIPRLVGPARVRDVSLVEIMDPATGMPMMALLNNLPFHTSNIEMPKVNTIEQWNIINTTGDTHPIHLHLVQFQVLGRQKFNVAGYMAANYSNLVDPAAAGTGPWPAPSADPFATGGMAPPDPNEMGWKDTVRANPGEITRIMVPFGAEAAPGVPFGNSYTGDYVWHCHILEHEDNEMMLPYRVVP